MFKILVDTLVLGGIISVVRSEDMPEWLHLIFVALGMAVANLLCAIFLGPLIGFLVILPIVLIDGLILMYFCSLTIKQAIITISALIGYNIVWQLIF
jgi:uncharacterized membrane protein